MKRRIALDRSAVIGERAMGAIRRFYSGFGMGAAGSGTSLVGGRSRVILRTGGPEETVVMGSIDAGAIERAILAHRDAFKLCYEREINAGHPSLASNDRDCTKGEARRGDHRRPVPREDPDQVSIR